MSKNHRGEGGRECENMWKQYKMASQALEMGLMKQKMRQGQVHGVAMNVHLLLFIRSIMHTFLSNCMCTEHAFSLPCMNKWQVTVSVALYADKSPSAGGGSVD